MSEQLPFPSDLAVLQLQLHYARERDRQAREMFHQIRRKMGEVHP